MLTAKSVTCWNFIHKRVQRDGVPVLLQRRMRSAERCVEIRHSTADHGAWGAVGFIRGWAHRAARDQMSKMPLRMERAVLAPRVIEGDRSDPPRRRHSRSRQAATETARHGAGSPQAPRSRRSPRWRAMFAVPQQMLAGGRSHYALEV